MKIASFVANGKSSYGLVEGEKIIDVGTALGSIYPDLRDVLATQDPVGLFNRVERFRAPTFRLEEVRLKPVIGNPEKIICVGLNYEMHREETGRSKTDHPVLFTRFANTQVGHGEALWVPRVSDMLDFEGELAVIIGKKGRYISEEKALEHVAGYACYNDASVRDWQRHTSQFTPGKNFLHTGAFGPWMVTSDIIENPSALEVTTRLNGQVMQAARTDMLIFSIPTLIYYCSHFTELVSGDVIVTGTPGGVGFTREPPVFMKPGDRVEVEISRIGILANDVEREPDS